MSNAAVERLRRLSAEGGLPEVDALAGDVDALAVGTWAIRTDWPMLIRKLDADRFVAVAPYLFTHAILTGRVGDLCDFGYRGYEHRWCYPSPAAAVAAFAVYDGEGDPLDGWVKQPTTGRRRPDGTPESERYEP